MSDDGQTKERSSGSDALSSTTLGDVDGQTRMIGARLRELRLSRSLGLRETARRAGISHGLLSQVETGRTSPSIATLSRIAAVLGITLFDAQFALHASTGGRIVRRHHRREVVYPTHSSSDWLLTLDRDACFSAFFTEIDPGADSGGPYAHLGGQEFVYVLSGSLEFGVGDELHELGPGDAVNLRAHEAHRWRNSGDEPARLLWVIENAGVRGRDGFAFDSRHGSGGASA